MLDENEYFFFDSMWVPFKHDMLLKQAQDWFNLGRTIRDEIVIITNQPKEGA